VAEQNIGLVVMSQVETEWCWAACASAMSQCDPRAIAMEQCQIVAAFPQNATACDDPDGNNVQGALNDAMSIVSLPNEVIPLERFSFDVVTESIARERPVGVRLVDKTEGTAHNVVVVGCDATQRTVVVTDPWGNVGTAAPSYRMPFTTLLNNYGDGGWGRASDAFVILP
jgi:hypothetical protein